MNHFFSHPVPAVVILLGLLVFFHELGHYIVGRLCGIAVETFSIGFGPRIFGFTHAGTDYRISWVPLGGYVKFAGSHPSEEVPAGLKGKGFLETSVGRRAATVLAGPLANFILAISVYTILGLDGMPHPPALIGGVLEGSAAARSGLQYNDRVVRIDGKPVQTWRDLEERIAASPGKRLELVVDRAGPAAEGDEPTAAQEPGYKPPQQVSLVLTPEAIKTSDMIGRPATIGRAGISLAREAAVLTVVAADGAAAQAGIKTGDQVVSFGSGAAKHAVHYYPQLVALLRDAAASGQTSAHLEVQSAAIVDGREDDGPAAAPQAAPVRQIDLPLSPAAVHAAAAGERDFMRSLGLSSSELTVGLATDGAKDVLQRGDILTRFNGKPLSDVFSLREQLIAATAAEADFTVQRNFASVDVKVQLKSLEAQRPDGPVTLHLLPVQFWGQLIEPKPLIEKYTNPLSALAFGWRETAIQTRELVANVVSLITGDIPLKALGGPMLIAKVAGDSARRGWQTFLGSMALISINLGLLNLFPIPVLDGGQLVLMGVEAARRQPLREAAIENFQKVGFAMIMALVVLATYNDLSRFWKSMLESVVGLFR